MIIMLEKINNLHDLEVYCNDNILVKEEKRLVYNKYYKWFKDNNYDTKDLVISLAYVTKIIKCSIDDILDKKYIPKPLNECIFEEALDINPNYVDFFNTKFLNLSESFYQLLFNYNYRINTLTSTMNEDIKLFKTYINNGYSINIINLYKGSNIKDKELLDILFTNNYLINSSSPKGIKNSTYALSKALSYNYDSNIIDLYDDYIELDKDFIDYIFKHGYKISPNSCKKILSNAYAFICSINNGENINIINLYINNDNIIDSDIKLLREIVLNNNYLITDKTPKVLLNDKEIIQSYIVNNINKINIHIIDYIDIELDEYIIELIFDKGYKININTKLYILEYNNIINKIYKDKYLNVCRNLFNELNSNYEYLVYFLECINTNNKLLLEYIDNDFNFKYILKYIFYGSNNLRNNLINIINNNQYVILHEVYNILFDKFNINIFANMVNNYKYNTNLYTDIINNKESISNDIKILLIKKLVYDNSNFYIQSINDLNKYKEFIYINNNNDIESNNIIYIKNMIFRCLFNLDYYSIKNMLNTTINSLKIMDLINSTSCEYLKKVLIEYKYIIELIEYIYTEEDKDILKSIGHNINNSDYSYIWNTFKDLESDIKKLYGKEINEKITNINELVNTNYLDIPKLNGELLYEVEEFDNIKYIKLNGIPFILFIHEINKYGKNHKIYEYKEKEFIDKSYISLSAIGDNYCIVDKEKTKSIDDVVLIFDNLNGDNLVLMSNDDIMSNTGLNDLNITSLPPNFNSIRTNITMTKYGNYNYSEYIYYRENLNIGAVLVLEDEPNEYEINAAKYFDVPLLKINNDKYPNKKYNERIKRDNELSSYYKKLYNKRNSDIDNKILNRLIYARELISKYFILKKDYKIKKYKFI